MDYKSIILEAFNDPESLSCIKQKFEQLTKDASLAKVSRQEGTSYFINHTHNCVVHEHIWKCYLSSIALSPNESEDLALSYTNMSALLYHICKYDECIKNINRALEITKSTPLKIKLLCRKAKCYASLKTNTNNNLIEEAELLLQQTNDCNKKELSKFINKAKTVVGKSKNIDESDLMKNLVIKDVRLSSVDEETLMDEKIGVEEGNECSIEDTESEKKDVVIKEYSELDEEILLQENRKDDNECKKIYLKEKDKEKNDYEEKEEAEDEELNVEKITVDEEEIEPDCNKYNERGANKKKKKKKKMKMKLRKPRVVTETTHLDIINRKEKLGVLHSVSLITNETYGKHLVANKYIRPGDVIFVSKPYILVPNLNDYECYCNNCLRKVWFAIPCENCIDCIYCSKKCQKEAFDNYHNIECSVLRFVVNSNNNSSLNYVKQASMRAIISAVKEFESIENLRKVVQDNAEYYGGYSLDGKFRNNSFISLFAFLNIYVEPDTLKYLAQLCCKIVIGLAKCSSFFGNSCKFDTIESLIENEDVIFISTLLLRVSVTVYNNAIKVTEKSLCKNRFSESVCAYTTPCCERGYSLNTINHFIPHSCDSNVKTIKTEDGREIVYALQPIYKGQSLFESYRSTFYEMEYEERHKSLIQVLNMDCFCTACTEKWPAVLLKDGVMMNMDEILQTVLDSRQCDCEKGKFYCLLVKHDLAHQKVVYELSDIIEASYNYFGQPSVELCAAIYTLNRAFYRLYDLKPNMPHKCRTL